MKGLGPTHGFEGEEFKEHSFRHRLAGQKLANGFKNLGLKNDIDIDAVRFVLWKAFKSHSQMSSVFT